MKQLFFYLLKKYSKTEKQRLLILSKLDDTIHGEYSEQTSFGNVYNYFIEFMISNDFVKSKVLKSDTESLEILKRGIISAFDESVEIMNRELTFQDGENKKRKG